MKYRPGLIMLLTVFALSGCYRPIEGRVIDAETQQPIEGAVVLVEWTKRHGIGHYWTTSYKVIQVVSDKDGIVKIEGCYSPFVEPPDVTVYRKGYVAWSDKSIFPEFKRRTDFAWGDTVFKLEKFKNTYSYVRHELFIHDSIHVGLASEKKQLFLKKYQDGEEKQVIQERNDMRSK